MSLGRTFPKASSLRGMVIKQEWFDLKLQFSPSNRNNGFPSPFLCLISIFLAGETALPPHGYSWLLRAEQAELLGLHKSLSWQSYCIFLFVKQVRLSIERRCKDYTRAMYIGGVFFWNFHLLWIYILLELKYKSHFFKIWRLYLEVFMLEFIISLTHNKYLSYQFRSDSKPQVS